MNETKWTPMEDTILYVELTKEEVNIIHNLLEKEVDSGNEDSVLYDLLETFEVLNEEE